MKKKYIYLVLLMGIICLFSCEEQECNRETRFFLQVNFYELNEQNSENSAVLAINELTVYGLEKPDSLLYNSTNNIRSFFLPLDSNADQSTFVIENTFGVDTLSIGYDPRPEYISKECGISMTYTVNDTTFTDNGIQELRIINPLVNANSNENIRLYY